LSRAAWLFWLRSLVIDCQADKGMEFNPKKNYREGIVVGLNKSIKSILGRLAAVAGVYERDFKSRMIVVAFHRINDDMPEDGLTCSSEKFDAFCTFFKEYFRVVSFEEQVVSITKGIDMGGTLSITFDDGYRDNAEVAAPVLRKHNLPATFFVTTGFIDSTLVPFWDEQLPHRPGWMTWDQVRELSKQGFDIGCHTSTHINMATTEPDIVRAELTMSKARLEAELGKPIRLFAYPFGGRGQISERSLELVKEVGFISCASCYGGTNKPIDDPYNLKRIGIATWFATPHQFGAEMVMGKV
jgi:peptidoglycan/xylan/chitin deacetylase (PgdA/CDA1 family)